METSASHHDRGGPSSHLMCRLFKWNLSNQTDKLSLQTRLCQSDLAVHRPGCAEQADSAAVVFIVLQGSPHSLTSCSDVSEHLTKL